MGTMPSRRNFLLGTPLFPLSLRAGWLGDVLGNPSVIFSGDPKSDDSTAGGLSLLEDPKLQLSSALGDDAIRKDSDLVFNQAKFIEELHNAAVLRGKRRVFWPGGREIDANLKQAIRTSVNNLKRADNWQHRELYWTSLVQTIKEKGDDDLAETVAAFAMTGGDWEFAIGQLLVLLGYQYFRRLIQKMKNYSPADAISKSLDKCFFVQSIEIDLQRSRRDPIDNDGHLGMWMTEVLWFKVENPDPALADTPNRWVHHPLFSRIYTSPTPLPTFA